MCDKNVIKMDIIILIFLFCHRTRSSVIRERHEGLNVFWYVVDRKIHKDDNLVTFLNKQEGIRAFIPKIEKWYSVRGVKDYFVKDLYPDHMFIVTDMGKDLLFEKYKELFHSKNNIFTLNTEEQLLMEYFYSNEDVIKHSIGNIVNSQLIIDEGPLLNYKGKITKINRHHRTATLKNIFSMKNS